MKKPDVQFLSSGIVKNKSFHVLEKNWYVFYTLPRAEKIAFNEISIKGHEVFLPTVKEIRLWKNRQKKWIDRVLMPGYIFVYTSHDQLFDVQNIPKIVTFIHCGGKPSIIKPQEIDAIKNMIDMDASVSVDTIFCKGDPVRVVKGPLTGYEGILTNLKGKNRFGIMLEQINQTILVDINVSMLEKI